MFDLLTRDECPFAEFAFYESLGISFVKDSIIDHLKLLPRHFFLTRQQKFYLWGCFWELSLLILLLIHVNGTSFLLAGFYMEFDGTYTGLFTTDVTSDGFWGELWLRLHKVII